MSKITATIAASALVVLGAVTLTGCSAVNALVYNFTDATYADGSALADDLGTEIAWSPGDAQDIHVRRSTTEDAPDVVVMMESSATLDPELCREVERQSAPTWALDGAPDVYEFDTVTTCGDWSIVPTSDGWLGWTPNSVGERESAAQEG